MPSVSEGLPKLLFLLFYKGNFFLQNIGDIWAQNKFKASDLLAEQKRWIQGLEIQNQ